VLSGLSSPFSGATDQSALCKCTKFIKTLAQQANIIFESFYICNNMKFKKLTNTEWMFIVAAVVLVVLIVLSWDRVSSRIVEVWNIYKP
jgi:hypothetical protein